jgi:hypothetical protein
MQRSASHQVWILIQTQGEVVSSWGTKVVLILTAYLGHLHSGASWLGVRFGKLK